MRILFTLLGLSIVACTSGDDLAGPSSGSHVASIEALTPTSLTATVGTAVTPPPRVRILSAAGEPLAGVRVTFISHGGAIRGDGQARGEVVMRSDIRGIAELPVWEMQTSPGEHRLRVRAGDAEVVFTAMAETGPVATLLALGAIHQVGAAGSTLFKQLQVRADDAFGNPVVGAEVRFDVTGGGSVTSPIATTGTDGVATGGEWTLGPNEGAQRVAARSAGVEMIFHAEACALPCPELLFVHLGNIHLFDFATGRSRPLTLNGRNQDPAWSPDGRWIAYARAEPDGGESSMNIFVMSADDPTIVQQRTTKGPFHSPTWSGDGRWLAVAGKSTDCYWGCELFTLELASTDVPRRIMPMAAQPAWSPVSSTIAFVGLSGEEDYHALRTIDASGDTAVDVLPRSFTSIGSPSWSPDGQRLVFSRCDDGCDLYTIAADGSLFVRLTYEGRAGDPAWSPDGRYIAYTLNGQLVYMRASGGPPIRLGIPGQSAAWRPRRD